MTFGTMSYHGASEQPSNLKYVGGVASGYDAKREQSPKWVMEQQIIEEMLGDLPQGSWVLDAPCGTGRFTTFCRDKGFIYRGLDISNDMIAQAVAKLNNESPIARLTKPSGEVVEFPQLAIAQGNVLKVAAPDKSVDCTLNIRISRWLSPSECQQMFTEMQRISRDRIILTARVCEHAHMRPLQIFEAVMNEDWVLERNKAGYEPQYRIFMFRNKKSPLLLAKNNVTIDMEKTVDNNWTLSPYNGAK